jgi:chemotaxis protein methyltransferase CheR
MRKPPEPDPPADAFSQALALYERGRYSEAVERLAPLASLEQAPTPVVTLLARACANQGDLPAALRWIRQAISCDRLNSRLHYLCGMIQQEMHEASEASASLRRAIYLDSDFIMAHVAMGHLAQQQGKIGEGTRNFNNALQLLRGCGADEIVPESDGMSAGRLAEMIAHLRDTNLLRSEVQA